MGKRHQAGPWRIQEWKGQRGRVGKAIYIRRYSIRRHFPIMEYNTINRYSLNIPCSSQQPLQPAPKWQERRQWDGNHQQSRPEPFQLEPKFLAASDVQVYIHSPQQDACTSCACDRWWPRRTCQWVGHRPHGIRHEDQPCCKRPWGYRHTCLFQHSQGKQQSSREGGTVCFGIQSGAIHVNYLEFH